MNAVERIPVPVLHFGKNDPETYRGGVETFARNLRGVFERVEFASRDDFDPHRVRRERPMVICDNQWAASVPPDIPVIGFQHGVAAVKWRRTWARRDAWTAFRQARAARRPKTIWVACARWISRTFAERHGNAAQVVIRHPIDLQRFDGHRTDVDPTLVLHDARGEHKGKHLVAMLAERFPKWSFEPLDCRPDEVPDRMRRGRAFIHLSRYEGNSIVCNEAMAMDLPCLFTRVGLMQDEDGPDDVTVVDPGRAFDDSAYLCDAFARFAASLDGPAPHPRRWVEANATPALARERWAEVVGLWRGLPW